MKGKWILCTALLLSLLYSNAWQYTIDQYGIHIWHPCCALFIFLICLFVFLNFRQSFVAFVLMAYALNNLADEILFDPTKLQLNEITFAFAVPVLWVIKKRIHDRKRAKRMGME